jgi:mono/diheme cytochrome c family protein
MSDGWRAYNLTSDGDTGIGGWSSEDLQRYLTTGHSDERGSAFGPMAEAVHLSFTHLTPTDVGAVVEYVRSIPALRTADMPAPRRNPAPEDPLDGVTGNSELEAGALKFASLCAGCHGWTGVNPQVPHSTLTGTRAVNDPTATNVALAILHGASTLPPAGEVVRMPAFGAILADGDVAAVSNYVVARLGARPSSITADEVRKLRAFR